MANNLNIVNIPLSYDNNIIFSQFLPSSLHSELSDIDDVTPPPEIRASQTVILEDIKLFKHVSLL